MTAPLTKHGTYYIARTNQYLAFLCDATMSLIFWPVQVIYRIVPNSPGHDNYLLHSKNHWWCARVQILSSYSFPRNKGLTGEWRDLDFQWGSGCTDTWWDQISSFHMKHHTDCLSVCGEYLWKSYIDCQLSPPMSSFWLGVWCLQSRVGMTQGFC